MLYKIMIKKCTHCSKDLLSTDFHKSSKNKDGFQFWCKNCEKSRIRDWSAYRHPRPQPNNPLTHKICATCTLEKPFQDFYKCTRAKIGITHSCKKCLDEKRRKNYQTNILHMRKLSKEYYWNNREQNLKYAKNWRKNNPEIAKLCMKKSQLKINYNLSWDKYTTMLASQANRCKICGIIFDESMDNKPHVDHNHKTGKIRGLLCRACNLAAGFLKDDSQLATKMSEYLQENL